MIDTYNGGYTKALIDVVRWFENHSNIIKFYKLYGYGNIVKILKALLENREELRETGDVSLVYNREKKVFKRDEHKERMKNA